MDVGIFASGRRYEEAHGGIVVARAGASLYG